ncbi:acetyltransferase [Salinivibrio sp. SS3]|uniref:sugar O-acetyltransferase n=1 Tax=Salinivibrio TaxID=51366 RepID=UPI000848304E|nr:MULTISPECIES: sugar O-acetyltransferase [Salinivibrio]ODP96931.1 acetyltransferase [Salinivibrio sp. BNH]WBA12679.1 sugar O-acetyltransferase [Salinivibrio kushneri]
MTEWEKMCQGLVFDDSDGSIDIRRDHATRTLLAFNQTIEATTRQQLLRELLSAIGEGSVIQPPFYCEFGETIRVGSNTLINMNVTMLDGAPITIGHHVLIGPNTQFYTPTHSLDYQSRRAWETWCKPIVVEDDVWIGGNVVICQGVTIGARSVIAANSVVKHDVPPDSLYGGTPARHLKALSSKQEA